MKDSDNNDNNSECASMRKRRMSKMTFESLKGKINVLEIVRQRVPGCRTGVGKRPSFVRGQIDTEKSSSPRPAERR